MPSVMITRPKGPASALANRLTDLGYLPICEPLLRIQLDPKPIDCSGVQAVVFTSANAVASFCRTNTEHGFTAFAVGHATASEARRNKFSVVYQGTKGAKALVDEILDKCSPEMGEILHVSGEEVKINVASALQEFGFKARREVVYRAEPVERFSGSGFGALRKGTIDAVIFFSPRTGQTFANLIQNAQMEGVCKTLRAVCFSRPVAAELNCLAWKDVIIAREPSTDSLVAALRKCFN